MKRIDTGAVKIMEVSWAEPKSYPRDGAVYAILLDTGNEDRYKVVKVGATRVIYARLSGYWNAFNMEPRLKFVYCEMTDGLKESFRNLFRSYDAKCEKDARHLEYVIEAFLLNWYKEKFGRRPPGNHDSGASKKYKVYIDNMLLNEKGDFKILKMEPIQKGILPGKLMEALR